MTGYIKIELTEDGREETEDGLRVNQGAKVSVELRDVHHEDKSFLMAKMAEILGIDNCFVAMAQLMDGFDMIEAAKKDGGYSKEAVEKKEDEE